MRRIIVTEFMSLDGVIENPMWTFPYWNDEIAQFKGEETTANDVLLLGRVTYEGFAASWPKRTGAESVQTCAMIFCTGYLLLVTLADVCGILANPRLRHR